MKNFKKFSIATVSILVFSLILGLTPPITAYAATAPNMGVASGYSVFGNAGITETVAQLSRLWGNAGGNGFGHASLIASQVTGTIDAGANVPVVGAISAAYSDLADDPQTGAINLALSPTVTPGVYDIAATAFNSTLTLNGAGVYIFRSTSSIAQTAGGTMSLTNGATACNVFWQIPTSMTFAAAGSIAGTIITNTGLISFVSGLNLQGRAWAATQVTMDNNQITEPTCVSSGGGSSVGNINVVKTVVNDSGGTKTVADFPLFVNSVPVVSGVTKSFTAPVNYTVTETTDANYTKAFSGDCDIDGKFRLNVFDNKFCIVTNNDIGAPLPVVPPLIDVVKTASPLSLPLGAGPVIYTYTLRNIGTVPVTNITMVGDTCSPIVLNSGDVNSNSVLEVSETWVYKCTTTLQATHTNTVVATGWANGISAVDIASATVIVGAPIVPPLIHVTKIPSPLTLLSGPGFVTYTNKVTNPGTIALSSVKVTDDKCSPVNFISGDVNNDSKLDISETWTYTCRVRLSQTTTNTVIATGIANGLTARDFAIATVVVASPSLPKTGFPPQEKNSLIALISIFAVTLISIAIYKKQVA